MLRRLPSDLQSRRGSERPPPRRREGGALSQATTKPGIRVSASDPKQPNRGCEEVSRSDESTELSSAFQRTVRRGNRRHQNWACQRGAAPAPPFGNPLLLLRPTR